MNQRYEISRLIVCGFILVISPAREAQAQGADFLGTLLSGWRFPGLVLKANSLTEQYRFEEALDPALEALEISKKIFGPNDEATADSYFMVASLLWVNGDLNQARKSFEECLAIRERRLPSDHPELADALKMLGGVLRDLGRFDEAGIELERARSIRAGRFGEDHPATAEILENLGTLNQMRGAYAEARRQHEHALAIRLRELPAGDPALATSFHNIGSLLQAMGDLRGAEAHYEQALAIAMVDEPDSLATAHVLDGFGNLLAVRGELEHAEKYQAEALEIYKDKVGENHVFFAKSINNRGYLRSAQGNLKDAVSDLKHGLEIMSKNLGEEHPETLSMLNNLGTMLTEAGELSAARRRLERALDLRRRVLGLKHPDTAMSMTSLGTLLCILGNFQEGIPLLQRSFEILLETFGPDHSMVAQVVNNTVVAILGQTENNDYSQIDLAEAERLLRMVLQVEKDGLAADSNRLVLTYNNIATVLEAKGDSDGARSFLEKALSIVEANRGINHWYAATTYYNLGAVARSLGDRQGLRAALEEAVELHRKTLGDHHISTMLSLITLASVLEADGHIERALDLMEFGLELQETELAAILATGSEQDKTLFLDTFRYATSLAVAFHQRSAPRDPRALAMGLNTVLRRKGRVLDAVAVDLRQARASSADGDELKTLIRLREEKLSDILRGKTAGASVGRNGGEVREHRDRQIRELERRIAEASAREDELSITWQAIQKALPERAVLIEMFMYWIPDVMSFTVSEPRYAAYLLRGSGLPRFVDLGEAAAIEVAARGVVEASSGRRLDVRERAREAYRQIFEGLEPFVQGADLLLFAPDDELHLLPFAVLVDEGDSYLIERFSIGYLTSGRDLLRLSRQPAPPREEPLIVADPDYGARPAAGGNRGPAQRAADLGALRFGQLEAAAQEAVTVGAKLGLSSDRILLGRAATETAVKAVAGPRVLHVATHGFFLPESPYEPMDPLNLAARQRLDDPLLRSGLALAGFNNWQMTTDSDDGVLTAQEVAHLDLQGTEIAVLSACETGVGEVRNGRGVFGLRRALVLAGARTQVMTLWQVADKPTKDIMVSWYEQVLDGVPGAEAMRQAQLAALRGVALPGTMERGVRPRVEVAAGSARLRHPYYWAPFIVSGDPGS